MPRHTTSAISSTVSVADSSRFGHRTNLSADWPDARCLTILERIKAAVAPDSVLLVDEMVVPARNAHKIATQVDLTMLSNLAAEERSD